MIVVVEGVDIEGEVVLRSLFRKSMNRDVQNRRVVADSTVHLTPQEWERIEREIRRAIC